MKGGRRQGRQRKRWEDNIRERTGLEFAKSKKAAENRGKWRKLVVKSSVVHQRPSRLRARWRRWTARKSRDATAYRWCPKRGIRSSYFLFSRFLPSPLRGIRIGQYCRAIVNQGHYVIWCCVYVMFILALFLLLPIEFLSVKGQFSFIVVATSYLQRPFRITCSGHAELTGYDDQAQTDRTA